MIKLTSYIKKPSNVICNGSTVWHDTVAMFVRFMKPYLNLNGRDINLNKDIPEEEISIKEVLETINTILGNGYIIVKDPRKERKKLWLRHIENYLEWSQEPLFTLVSFWRQIEGVPIGMIQVRSDIPIQPIIINGIDIRTQQITYLKGCNEFIANADLVIQFILDAKNVFIINTNFVNVLKVETNEL